MWGLEATTAEQINWGVISGISATVISVGGFLHSIWKSKKAVDQGVTEQRGVERRDTVTDRDSLIDQLQEELEAERRERKEQAIRFDNRITGLEADREADREYIQTLLNHIWQQLPPPPPPRWGSTS